MKISIKILSVMFAVVIFISAIPISSSARSLADIEADIKKQEQKLEASANSTKNEKEKIEEYNKQNKLYDEQIALINKELEPILIRLNELEENIAALEKRISELESRIKELEAEAEVQNKTIDETYDVLAERLRASYMAGETSELEIFLSATDFQDFLNRSELVRQIAKRDNELVADLEKQVKELEEMISELDASRIETEESKDKIEADRAEQNEKKKVQETKKKQVENAQAKVQANILKSNEIIEKNEQSAAASEDWIAKFEREYEEFAAAMDKEAGNGSSGDGTIDNGDVNHNFKVSSKGFISPIQDKSVYYSATFAQHSARGTASVDFCAPANRVYTNGKTYNTTNGAKIYAVASGTVKSASYQSTGGNYIMIDHGNGMSSAYAHCRSINVSVGQKVKQGQVIGLVGNTGSAVYPRPTSANPVAGSHLHFEMRLNGKRVNPEKYLPSPLVY